MNELQIFIYTDKQIRTLLKDGEPWFVAKDICEILEISNANMAAARLDDDEVSQAEVTDSLGRLQKTNIINEMGLYNLILRSDKPEAKQFKRWITHEVIPSIRKYGAYVTPDTLEKMITSPEFGIRLLTEIKEERNKRQKAEAIIDAQKPQVLFAQAVEVSKTSILIGDLAKLIKQNGCDTGQKRLFQFLRENEYLIKSGSSKNMPTQRSMNAGWFEVKESTINNPDGSVRITKTTKVTGRGQVYFINLFLKKGA